MKFPLSTLNEAEYNDKLKELIFETDAKLFFDTNLFSQLFKIYPEARAEFYAWVDPEIANNRICISSWSMNEYVSRFITNKLSEYTGDIKKIKTIKSDLENVRSFLRMYIDNKNLEGTIFSNREEYFAELDIVVEKFEKVANATKEISDYWNVLNAELASRFESTVMPSNIYSIIQDIQREAEIRMQNRVPPGFKDDDAKSDNKHGDLIIWKEILNYCNQNTVTKAIFISNDGKKDLVYKPQKMLRGGRLIPNSSHQLPDPRLVYEFKQHTGSEEFYIIKFATLVQFLWENDNDKFVKLSKAIQISEASRPVTRHTLLPAEEPPVQANEVDVSAEPTDVAEVVESIRQEIETIEGTDSMVLDVDQQEPVEDISLLSTITDYSLSAIADGDFEYVGHERLAEILAGLRTYTWDVQNRAMDKLGNTALNLLPAEKLTNDYLFVLGRNLYQAACGNAFRAIDFIMNIPQYLRSIPIVIREHMVNGLLFEIYFNSKGQFRNGNFKVGYIEQLFALQTMPEFQSSVAFIRRALDSFKDCLIVQPNVHIEYADIVIHHKPAPPEEGIIIKHILIEDILVGDKHLLIDDDIDDIAWDAISDKQYHLKLIPRISAAFAVPVSQMRVTFTPPLDAEGSWIFTIPKGKMLGIGA